jgi:predicted DsbA family dithiol-disulfide isomerase
MRIDLFHDTACPWCRIGKQHLEQALEQWQGEPVEVHYRTFLLNPSMPPEGHEFLPFMDAKAGGRTPPGGWFEAPRQMGAKAGINFQFEKIERAPNTTLSHRLIAIAPSENKAAVVDGIYAAYFEHGQDIGRMEVLLEIASSKGLDKEEIRRQLESDAGEEQVRADVEYAGEVGISGVPFFIVNQKYAFSGAHPPESILNVLKEAAREAEE